VATPIGNLEDTTFRAVRVLKEVDSIACEDTRQTGKLLQHFEIHTSMVSYHEHNEARRAADLLDRLLAGQSIALVSDAGTPLVADPGYRLVAEAVKAGIRVIPIPGACAAIAALSASGLPTDSVDFRGFLPPKAGQRRRELEVVADATSTVIFYEAPHRLMETLADIASLLPDRPIAVARELTKVHEEFVRGTPAEVLQVFAARPAVKGELIVLIGKAEERPADDRPLDEAVEERIASGMTRMDAIKSVARARGLGKRELYRLLHERV
jgi:16S rRNA (cytidine1402-2'-O)-methyltransferase